MTHRALDKVWLTWGPVVAVNHFVWAIPVWCFKPQPRQGIFYLKELIDDVGSFRHQMTLGEGHSRRITLSYGGPLVEI